VSARSPSLAREIEAETARLAMDAGGLAPEPWVTGDALIGAGLTPGPKFKGWLEAIYDAQLEGRIRDAGEAMAMARGLASGGCL
jgi:poly(A) polymerase